MFSLISYAINLSSMLPTILLVGHLQHIGFYLEYQYLSHNRVYLGLTVFDDTDMLPMYNPAFNRTEFISVKKNTAFTYRGCWLRILFTNTANASRKVMWQHLDSSILIISGARLNLPGIGIPVGASV